MELKIVKQGGKFLVDSRDIAEMTEKQHFHLIRNIDSFVEVIKKSTNPVLDSSDFFIEGTYLDSKGEVRRKYDCTRIGCDMIANKMTGEKGVLFTAVYVTKFEMMEKQLKTIDTDTPSYMLEDPETRALKWIEEQRSRKLLESKNLLLEIQAVEFAPKIAYFDTILKSKATVTTSQIAKDYGLTATELNKVLKDEHVQFKVNDQWLLYKEHDNKGYTQSFTIDITRSDGRPDVKMNTRWTQNGRLFIHDILTNRGIKANIEKDYYDAK